MLLETVETGLFYDGSWVPGTGQDLVCLDPSTEQPIAAWPAASVLDLDGVLTAAVLGRRRTSPTERAEVLLRIAGLLRSRKAGLAEVISRDGGLPLSLAGRDVDAAARYFEFFAAAAQTVRGESIPLGPDLLNVTELEPYGTCLILLPFNFPLQIAARDCAPALAMGNSVVLKAPEQAPLAALLLAAVCHEAGAASGTVAAVVGDGSVGDALVRHPLVDHVTFTGSVGVGQVVMRSCAELVKPVTMELGGKSPHVVFRDAELGKVVSSVVGTTMRTAGQTCSAGTRLLVDSTVHARFVGLLLEAVAGLRVGPALDDPDVGPLISKRQQEAVLDGISRSVQDGSRLCCGSQEAPGGEGYFVAPAVFDGVTAGAYIEQNELFGPVVAVSTFHDEEEAIMRANGTEFGLAAAVWTQDVDRALRVSRRIEAGQVFVNTYGVGSGVELPFGGVRRSGFGRVKGLESLREYSWVKNTQISYKLAEGHLS